MPNIGKYEIESRIGHGGMGDVYRAYDPTLRRRVAIKVLKVEGDAETLNRFRLEATAAGNLNHSNIVTIHDYGDFEGEPYLVMEYLEGKDLQSTIESGRKFDLVEITDIMSQVADALECAHQHGVIHRDVKPANIMLLNRGGVKLMDFGIARLAGSNTQQTKVGHLVGTILYMSPEQFHNLELDRRVDIWAYGVIYYQLLAGHHPFQVPDQIVTMYNIANKPAPPICSVNSEVPEALGQIVDRCLNKDRDQRYLSMEDLRFDVLPVLQDLSRQQVARMLADARGSIEKADWEGAQAIVKRVLELDPADRSAHALRKTIAEAVKKRESAPQVQNLAAAAEQQIAGGEYGRAIELLETALRVDHTAEALRKRLDEARALKRHAERTVELLQTATRQLAADELAAAKTSFEELIEHEPGHPEATRMLISIQEEIAKRERQKALQEGIARGRARMRAGAYAEAVKEFQDLGAAFPGSLEVAQLLREAETARDEYARRSKLETEIAAVKDHLRAQRFPEAVQRLEALSIECPGENEVQQLLHYAREEWKVRQRAEAIERVKIQVAKLQAEGRFEEALRSLERAQTEFPNEADLARLAQAVAANKAEDDRRAAIEQTMQEARGKQRSGELTESLRIADLAIQQHGPDEKLLAFREQLERDWQTAQRNRALHQAISEGRRFMERREWEKAIAHLQQVARQYPEESEPKELLAEAEAALKREQRETAEKQALARAASLEQENQKEAAIAALDAVLKTYPDSEALSQARTRLQRELDEKRKTHERQVKLDEARRKAEAEQQRRAEEARLAQEEQRRQQIAKVEELLAKAYIWIGQSEFAKAAKVLAEARKVDAGHPGIARAESDLETARTRAPQAVAKSGGPSKISPMKGVLIGAGAAILVLAAAFAILHKPAPPVEPDKPKLSEPAKPPADDVTKPVETEKPQPLEVKRPAPETAPANAPAVAELKITPDLFSFEYQIGGPLPPPRIVHISGEGTFQAAVHDSEWVSVSPASGKLPIQVAVTVHPEHLPPGMHASTLAVLSLNTHMQKMAILRLNVEEAPKPVVNNTPPPPPPVQTTPTEPPQNITYLGRRSGDLVWTGTIGPGEKVVIAPRGPILGGGAVVRGPIPKDVAFDISNVTPGIQAAAGVNTLTLTNVSSNSIQLVNVHWAVK
jgi:serine/threonine-protein kinase